MKLTQEQCDAFRRHGPATSFDDMIRAIYEAGHVAGRAAAYAKIMDMAKEKLAVAGIEQCS